MHIHRHICCTIALLEKKMHIFYDNKKKNEKVPHEILEIA